MSADAKPLNPLIVEVITEFRKLSARGQEVYLELLRKSVSIPNTPDGEARFEQLCGEAKAKLEALS